MRQDSAVPQVAIHPAECKPLMKENGGNAEDVESGQKNNILLNSYQQNDPDDPELLANQPQKRNWRGIALALLVIAIISSIILLAIFLTTPRGAPDNYGPPFSFSDIFLAGHLLNTPFYQLSSDGVIHLHDYNIVLLDRKTNTSHTLLSYSVIEQKAKFNGYFSVNRDGTAAILGYDEQHVYRHSSTGKYDAVKFVAGDADSLHKRVELGFFNSSEDQPRLSACIWSPNGTDIAFIQHYHVYIHKDVFSSGTPKITKITAGLPDVDIRYGVPDWLYEEEILSSDLATWWSPLGTRITFVGFDDSMVKTQKMYHYGNGNDLYGSFVDVKYPKAGDYSENGNPNVKIFIYDIESGERREIERPAAVPRDGLFIFARWFHEDGLVIGWTDRIQKRAWITFTSWSLNTSWVVFRTEEQNGWVDLKKRSKHVPMVDRIRQQLYLILPRDYSVHRYRGIASLQLDITRSASLIKPTKWLVTPEYDVTDVLHCSDETGDFLYVATGPDPKNQHVYWASRSTGHSSCLTCGNPNCTFNMAESFQDGKHFIQNCRGPGIPSIYLMRINRTIVSSQNVSATVTRVGTVWDYAKLRQIVNSRNLPRVEYFNLTLRNGTRDQVTVNARLLVPRELNASHIKKYPLLVETYAGPTSQVVTTKLPMDWTVFLAATAKVVVLSVDGRGTGGRGQTFEGAIYKKLGVVEIEDQLDAVRAFVKSVTFINTSQIGAYGWSYGGFTVGHLLGHPRNDLIRCGVSVAPVTDFRYYDTAYSERYLGRITDEPDAYLQTQIARHARNFRSKSLLLVHGTADDNVHFINSAVLMRALIKANVDVEMMIYPDDDHTIALRGSREHLLRKVITFLLDCYNKTSVRHSINLSMHQEL